MALTMSRMRTRIDQAKVPSTRAVAIRARVDSTPMKAVANHHPMTKAATTPSVKAAMRRHAGPHVAMQRAYSLLQSTLDGQAQLWGYVDDFRYMALLCGGCVLVVMLLKKTRGSAEPAG